MVKLGLGGVIPLTRMSVAVGTDIQLSRASAEKGSHGNQSSK